MPKCRNCGETLTKFDKEICPYCGCKNPLEESNTQTCDVTQTIDTVEEKEGKGVFVQHKKILATVLCCLLGIFAADSFYLGFKKEGIIRIIINLVVIGGLFCAFYFPFKDSISFGAIGIAFGIVFLIYVIIGIISYFRRKKDANGVFLK